MRGSTPRTLMPLKVTAILDSAVVATEDVHLDALLAWVQAKRTGDLDLSRASPVSAIRDVRLPLARIVGPDDDWCWAASAWELPADATLMDEPTRLVRRRDGEDVEQMARRWTPGSGPGRNMRVRRQAVCAATVSWYCIGHRREIRKALQVVTAVGSMRRAGYGRVRSWSVKEVGSAPVLLDSTGRACRHLPHSWVDRDRSADVTPGHGGHRPPYWAPQRHGSIVTPGQAIKLVDGVRVVGDDGAPL